MSGPSPAGMPMKRLNGRAVIITGAGKGIGAAVAQRCAAEGAAVVVVDRDAETLGAVVNGIQGEGQQAAAIVGDIGEEDTVRRMTDAALESFGRLDGLVNNAGMFGAYARFESTTADAFDRIIDVNVKSAWRAMQLAKPAMLASGGGGAIVNIASMAARRANRGLSLYGMTKGAVDNLTINAATEYAKHGIRVNAILPGPIDTDMLGAVEEFIDERHSEVARAKINQSIPLGRYGRPEEIAAAAAFLLSDDAGFMTGARVAVDGGQSLE